MQLLAVASMVASLSLLAGGCAKQTPSTDKDMVSAGNGNGMQADTGEGMGQEESLEAKGWGSQQAGQVLEGRSSAPMLPVYYDFDKSNIRADQQPRLKKNGNWLTGNASVRIRIEGNCDERGTNEYNMALGERRALSAKKFLSNMGVAANRMDTISYGEEKPLNYGHDELAWSQNRRSDFVVSK